MQLTFFCARRCRRFNFFTHTIYRKWNWSWMRWVHVEKDSDGVKLFNSWQTEGAETIETLLRVLGKQLKAMLLRMRLVLLWYCFAIVDANKAQQKILSIEANCTRDLMHVKINMGRPFKGMVFAKGFSEECGSVAGKFLKAHQLNSLDLRAGFINRFSITDTSTIVLRNTVQVPVKRDNAIHRSSCCSNGFKIATKKRSRNVR